MKKLLKYSPWPILLFTLLLFIGTLGYEPLESLDDYFYVFGNPNLGFSPEQIVNLVREPVLGLWTPLAQLSYLIDYAVGGMEPWVFRLGNILWHLAGVYCVWLLCRELGLRRNAAFWVTLIYAIHPQRVESVVWIAERKDVLSAFFFFAALTAFLRLRKRGRFCSGWLLFFQTCALLAKSSTIALPLVMFLLEVYRVKRWNFRVLLKLWPSFLVSGIYFLLAGRMLAGGLERAATVTGGTGNTLLLMMRNYLSFAGKTFLPLELFPLYPYFYGSPGEIAGMIAVVILIVVIFAACFYLRKEVSLHRILPFLLIFGGMLAPFSGVFPFSNADFADRYSLLASVFLLIPAALLLDRQKRIGRKLLGVFLIVYAGYLAFFTLQYSRSWQNDRTLYAAACETARPNFRAAAIRAWQLMQDGDDEAALELIGRAGIGRVEEVNQEQQLANYRDFFAGMAAFRRGDQTAAGESLLRCAMNPYSQNLRHVSLEAVQQMYLALAEIALRRDDPATASQCYEVMAHQLGERSPFYRFFYRGVAAMIRRDYVVAVDCFEQADRIMPGNPETEKNLEAARERLAN